MEKKIFDKNTKIGEVLETDKDLKIVLEGFGMHCLGCPMSQMETLEEACEAHRLNVYFVLEKLNNFKK